MPNARIGQGFETALASYLRGKISEFSGGLSLIPFDHGQSNPTFIVRTTEKEYVLRKKPSGRLLPSAHAIEREYRLLQALSHTDVPAPEAYLLCEDPSVIGTPFYLMEKLEGRIFRDGLGSSIANGSERYRIFDAMNDCLCRIHNIDHERIGLCGFGKPGNYLGRQINRWTGQYRASQTDEIASMETLIRWLPENIPDDESTAIVHGDFRLQNLVFHPSAPEVVGVLDWELSTLGHPLADLAYNCLIYYTPYARHTQPPPPCPHPASLGIPSEEEYLAAYRRRTGMEEIANWKFFIAFSIFRQAAISQGIYKRGLDGTANSAVATTYNTTVRYLAEKALQIISGA